MSTDTTSTKVQRQARLRWVPIAKMKVSPLAQRDFKQYRVDHLVANFDLEQIGTPTVNERDGRYYVIDGQHRISALRDIGWGDQQIQCWTYADLTEQEEAERFLKLNDVLTVSAYDRFRVAVHAGREAECDVARIVRGVGLAVSQQAVEGGVSAVGTLLRVYHRNGPGPLARTLRIIRDAYGTAGLVAPVIDGIGLMCGRYNGELSDQVAVLKLGKMHGGVGGLLGKAEVMRKQMAQPKAHCVAAAAVEVINGGRGGKKLPGWFREDAA